MKKNIFKLLGVIALVTVIGFSMTACDEPGGGPPGGGGGLSPKDIDLDEIEFDAEDIYSGISIKPPPSNNNDANEVFAAIYPAIQTSYTYLYGAVYQYVTNIITQQTSSFNISETKNISQILDSLSDDYESNGILQPTGNVTIRVSGTNNNNHISTVTASLSYVYDSDKDNENSYSGVERMYFKVNVGVLNIGGLPTETTNYTNEINLSCVGVFALANYCGKCTSNTNYSIVNSVYSGSARATFYDLNDTQTYTRTFTIEELQTFN